MKNKQASKPTQKIIQQESLLKKEKELRDIHDTKHALEYFH